MPDSGTSSRALRVLHLGSPAGLYGAERWILALVRHLDRAQVQSTVGVINDHPTAKAPLLGEAKRLGCDTVSIRAPGRFNWRAVARLRAVLRERKFDVLHTHFYKTDVVGLLATRGTSCRLVTTPHGWSVSAGISLRLYESLDRCLFRFFDAVVPLSPDLYNGLQSRKIKGLKYIPNGVDLATVHDQISPIAELASEREPGTFVVGYVGQLIARKGLNVLLEAFAGLQLAKCRLILVGDGEQKQQLQMRADELGIRERTFFTGYQENAVSWMRGFDVFVLPSRLEGIPRCLMEAMAAGTPVVASDIPGSRELVAHGQTGMLFPMDDAHSLADTLRSLAANPSFRERLALAARELIVDRYSAAVMATAYTQLYMDIVPGSTTHSP